MFYDINAPQSERLQALELALSAAGEAAANLPRYFDEERARAFLPFRSKGAATKVANHHNRGWDVVPVLGGWVAVLTVVTTHDIRRIAHGRADTSARMRDLENLEFYG